MTAAQATQQAPIGPIIRANDRLGLTIFFAVVLHTLIILGISFTQPDEKKPPEKLPGLEVTLVQTRTDNDIEDADFLAQANQEGGGDTDQIERPTMDSAPVVPTGETGEVREFVAEMILPQASDPQAMQIMSVDQSKDKVKSEDNKQDIDSPQTQMTAAQMLSLSKDVQRQSAELAQMRKEYANRPRKAFVSARTKQDRFAGYINDWRQEIERTGTLNYPDEARRSKLSGNVRMTVSIASDGSVKDIKVTQFSGHKILDDAAVRIVKLAAPFAPFPEGINKDYDQIEITRTFQFISGAGNKKSRFRTRSN